MSESDRFEDRRRSARRRRPTLGFLGGPLMTEELAPGAADAARLHDVNLILFAGGMLEGILHADAQRAAIPDLVGPESVDGLFINTDWLGHTVGAERMRAFCSRFQPLPMVTCELSFPSVPTVKMDFYRGMVESVTHLIEVHGYRRIAFVQGPAHSVTGTDRYRAYVDTLSSHSIPLDEALIAPGIFFPPSGADAVHLFLDRRRLRPHLDVEAIVCVNDYTAMDTLTALQARGVRVPEEIAIVGFDDLGASSATSPALTTVYLPFYEAGFCGVEALLSVINGDRVPDTIHLPTTLLVRQSCGCPDRVLGEAALMPNVALSSGVSTFDELWSQRECILEDVKRTAPVPAPPGFDRSAGQLVDATLEALFSDEDTAFLDTLAQAVGSVTVRDIGRRIAMWQGVLSALRRSLYAHLGARALRLRLESLCHQGRLVIGQVVQRLYVTHSTSVADLGGQLRQMHYELASTLDVESVMNVLAASLPQLGIPSCYLSLYEDPAKPAAWSWLRLAYDDRGSVDLGPRGLRFPSRQLIPERLQDAERRRTLAVEPLSFGDEQFGFVVMEMVLDHLSLYEDVREQVSSTLKRVTLHREAVEARRIAEEANRLKSRFLSVVSHELRTPLNMIVALSDLLLQEDSPDSPTPYRNEIEVIHATGRHLNRLVRDVLDLGRSQLGQLTLSSRLLDLAEVLRDVVPIGEQMTRDKGLVWETQLPSSLPLVWGDGDRLRQVILNLIGNACKFTTHGCVRLAAKADDGSVTVSVQDTGLGVPLEEQAIIFDEFRQSERTAERGYGGMGLGLAISRRLVELHEGRMGVESTGEEGSGATFFFTLPVLATQVTAREIDPVDWTDVALIVSRGEGDSGPLHEYLDRRGFRTVAISVEDSDRWLAHARAAKPGAIILDCRASLEWGSRLIQALQQDSATSDIPVLLYHLSPDADAGAVLDLSSLSKPLESDALARALAQRDLLSGEPSAGRKTILIVDDDPAILRLHVRRLQELMPTAKVITARNGREALDSVGHTRPDLVLLDLMMPEMDGFAVLKALRSKRQTRTIPVIVLTACTLTEDVMAELNVGAAAILSKGMFTVEETLEHIAGVLAHTKRLGTEAQRIARQTMVFVHAHFAEPISRANIAGYVHVSDRYMTRCFREEMGITPIAYLNRYRVIQAQQLLMDGQKSITEIAMEVGFSSSSYFSRVFKRETGVLPRDYRRSAAVSKPLDHHLKSA